MATPAGAVAPAWSPTADVIAYLQPTMISQGVSRLWLMFVDSSGKPLFPDLPKQHFPNGFLAWSPDGRRLAAASVAANLAAAITIVEPDAKDAFRKPIDLPPTARPCGLTWSRDGSEVLVALHELTSDIVLYDVER